MKTHKRQLSSSIQKSFWYKLVEPVYQISLCECIKMFSSPSSMQFSYLRQSSDTDTTIEIFSSYNKTNKYRMKGWSGRKRGTSTSCRIFHGEYGCGILLNTTRNARRRKSRHQPPPINNFAPIDSTVQPIAGEHNYFYFKFQETIGYFIPKKGFNPIYNIFVNAIVSNLLYF